MKSKFERIRLPLKTETNGTEKENDHGDLGPSANRQLDQIS